MAGVFTAADPTPATAAGPIQPGSRGYDISFPQCPDRVPSGAFGFAIIGVNNGRAMTQNPCMPAQIAWARQGSADASVYINSNSPPEAFRTSQCPPTDGVCRAFEYGRESAAYAIAYVNRHAPDITRYWLDVETQNTWSSNTQENAAVLRGMIAALTGAGKSVGIYSNSRQFAIIAGSYAPGLDNWIPRPEAKHDTVAEFCRTTQPFGGGRVVMIQMWYTFDENYACAPGDGPPPPAPTTLKAGDVAVVTSGECLNLRGGTGLHFPVVECMADGIRVSVTGAPHSDGVYNWVPVAAPSGKTGWAAAQYLLRVADSPPPSPAPPARPHRIVIGNLAGD